MEKLERQILLNRCRNVMDQAEKLCGLFDEWTEVDFTVVQKEFGAYLPYVLIMVYAGSDLERQERLLPDENGLEYTESVMDLLSGVQDNFSDCFPISSKNPKVLSKWLRAGMGAVQKADGSVSLPEIWPEMTSSVRHIVLRLRRVELGLTQKRVADRARIPLEEYQKYESGECSIMDAPFFNVCNVLLALKMDPKDFYHGEYDPINLV